MTKRNVWIVGISVAIGICVQSESSQAQLIGNRTVGPHPARSSKGLLGVVWVPIHRVCAIAWRGHLALRILRIREAFRVGILVGMRVERQARDRTILEG